MKRAFWSLAYQMAQQESAGGAGDVVARPLSYSGYCTFQSFVALFLECALPGRSYGSSLHKSLSAAPNCLLTFFYSKVLKVIRRSTSCLTKPNEIQPA